MCQFLETIKLSDGEFFRLVLHQFRLEKAMNDFFQDSEIPDLQTVLLKADYPTNGLYKCRVIYDSAIRLVEFQPYTAPIIRSIKVVETEIASLPYKLANRADYQLAFSQRMSCDDVLLVKNGLIADTSYCNVALFDGENWITPRVPLIQGVNRKQLIVDEIIIEKDIKISDLSNFQSISLFNALNEFGTIKLDISSICL